MAERKKNALAGLKDIADKKKKEHSDAVDGKKKINRKFYETDPAEPMTIVLHKSLKKKLKQIAMDRDMTASALIEKWINEYEIENSK